MREEAIRFADKLLSKTTAGKLPWQETYDPNSFICVVDGELSFTIEKRSDESVSLEMKDGVESVVFRETMRAPDINTSGEYDRQYTVLSELHERARRAALQIDKKIAKAEQYLDKL